MTEESIIKFCLQSKENLEYIIPKIRFKYFSESTQWLIKIIVHYYKKYHSIISEEVILDLFNRDKISNDEMQRRLIIYNRIIDQDIQKENIEYFLDQLIEDYKRRKIFEWLETQDWGKKSGTDILYDINGFIHTMNIDDTESEIIELDIKNNCDYRKEQYQDRHDHPEKYKGIYIGIREFDKITNGVRPGELVILAAGTGEGKSIALLNFGYYAWWKYDKNIIYFTLEMPYEQIARRFDARHSNIPYIGLRDGTLDDEEEKRYSESLEDIKKKKNYFQIIDIPRIATAQIIENYIRKYKNADLIIIDYLGEIISEEKNKQNDWEKIAKTVSDIRGIARILKLPIISAVQINREGRKKKNKENIDESFIAGSDKIGHVSDIVLGLFSKNIINSEEKYGTAKMKIIKNRDGPTSQFDVFVDFNKILITNKSEEFSNVYIKEEL